MPKISRQCKQCQCEFQVCPSIIKKGKGIFCNKQCQLKFTQTIHKKCTNCNKDIYRQQSEIRKNTSGNFFCSHSCSAIYNNKNKVYKNKCYVCQKPVKSGRKYCPEGCNPRGMDITLKDAIYKQHHKATAFALVRSRARTIAKNLGWKSCSQCEYSNHIEICHIKPISEFDENTLLSVINHPSNLAPLCPNHHWEFDNGLIILK